MYSASRKSDSVISVCQHNNAKMVRITGANRSAEEIIGYKLQQIYDHDFNDLLPQDLKEHIEEYLDFEDQYYDLAKIISRTRNFRLKAINGREVPVEVKVFYTLSNGTSPCFDLLIRDLSLKKEMEDYRIKLQSERSALSNIIYDNEKEFLFQEIALVSYFIKKYPIEALFAVFSVNNFDVHSRKLGDNIADFIQEIKDRFNSSTRIDDSIHYIGNGCFAAIFFDCPYEFAKNVLVRIKWKLSSQEFVIEEERLTISLSAAYSNLNSELEPDQMVISCERALNNSAVIIGGRILEADLRAYQ